MPSRARELASSRRDETVCSQRGELAICELAIREIVCSRQGELAVCELAICEIVCSRRGELAICEISRPDSRECGGAESSPIPMGMGHGITNSPTGIVPGGLSQKIDLAKKSRLFSKSQKTSDHKSGKTMGNEFGIYPIHSATLCESAMRSRSRWT